MNQCSNRSILAFDVDDTVAESTQCISPEIADVLHDLAIQGYNLLFISGSTCSQIYNQIDGGLYAYPSMPTYHLMGNSGNQYNIVLSGDKQVRVINKVISKEQQEIVIKLMEMVCNHYGLVPLTSKEDQIQNREGQITLSVLGRHAPSKDKKNFDPYGDKRKEYITAMRAMAQVAGYNISGLSFNIGGTTSIDVTLDGSDKGEGIRTFLRHNLWAWPSNIAFFGDNLQKGGNDHPVARHVPLAVQVEGPEHTLEILNRIRDREDNIWDKIQQMSVVSHEMD